MNYYYKEGKKQRRTQFVIADSTIYIKEILKYFKEFIHTDGGPVSYYYFICHCFESTVFKVLLEQLLNCCLAEIIGCQRPTL